MAEGPSSKMHPMSKALLLQILGCGDLRLRRHVHLMSGNMLR